MLLDDSSAFCLLVPTYEGTAFVRRLLEFLRAEGFPGQVILSDNSSPAHREFVLSCPRRYPELWLELQEYPCDTGFVDKLARSLSRIGSRYVMLCGQDDFVVPEGVEALLQLLETDGGLSCARGRVARFHVRVLSGSERERTAAVDFNKHPMLPYQDLDPAARVLAHLRAYTSTLYSVHRREVLLEAMRRTDEATRNVVFWQYLSSCITVALGRVACLDQLFLARQIHRQSWSAGLVGDREHWPLLLTSPRYSEYYQQFRTALLGLVDIDGQVDEAYVSLVRRALCRVNETDAGNESFFARLQTSGTPENIRVNGMARFSLAHEGTY